MQKNIGTIDRTIRLFVGFGLCVWAIAFSGPVWAYIGIVPIITASLKWCPLYALMKIKSF